MRGFEKGATMAKKKIDLSAADISSHEGESLLDVKPLISPNVLSAITAIPVFLAGLTILIILYVKWLYSFDAIVGVFFWVFMVFWPIMVYGLYNWVAAKLEGARSQRVFDLTPSTNLSTTYASMSYEELQSIGRRQSDDRR